MIVNIKRRYKFVYLHLDQLNDNSILKINSIKDIAKSQITIPNESNITNDMCVNVVNILSL